VLVGADVGKRNDMIQHNNTLSVFTTDNEPYLGLMSVLWFDRIICWSMESNTQVATWTRINSKRLTSLQRAACQIIPQGVGMALSIRELIRQAYLFSALVLIRPLIERAAVVSYLDTHPDAVSEWENGWRYRERPKLATMLASMANGTPMPEAQKICDAHNHMVHGDPLSCCNNLITLPDGTLGYACGKMLNSPQLCDEIAMESQCYLIVLCSRMLSIFPDVQLRPPPEKD
jgi:hypothetical protein